MSADKLHPCTLYQHIVELKHEIGRRSTNQPINRAPNEPARPTFVQKCLFGVKNGQGAKFLLSTYQKTTYAPCSHCFLVGFGNKWVRKANQWPKITENSKFGPFLAQNSIFRGGRVQKFWHLQSGKHETPQSFGFKILTGLAFHYNSPGLSLSSWIHSKNVFVSGIQMNFWGPGPFF